MGRWQISLALAVVALAIAGQISLPVDPPAAPAPLCNGAANDLQSSDFVIVGDDVSILATRIPSNVSWTAWSPETYYCVFPMDSIEPGIDAEIAADRALWCAQENCSLIEPPSISIPQSSSSSTTVPNCNYNGTDWQYASNMQVAAGCGAGFGVRTNLGFIGVISFASSGSNAGNGECYLRDTQRAAEKIEQTFRITSALDLQVYCILGNPWPAPSPGLSTCYMMSSLESYVASEYPWITNAVHHDMIAIGWVQSASNNGCAVLDGTDTAGNLKPFTVVASTPRKYANLPCTNWRNDVLAQHELSHIFAGMHHPDEARVRKPFVGVMNYWNAGCNKATSYDGYNNDRIAVNLWH